MRVYLCRHGEAVDGSEELADELRWLTPNGRRTVGDVGAVLREEGEKPDLILTSPLVRAVQTADVLAQATKYRDAIEVLQPLAPGGGLGDVVQALAELGHKTKAVYLVGHEPQMSEWAAELSGQRSFGRSFQKGAVARLSWKGPPEPGTGKPGFYLSPAHLKLEPW
jgi:phosphohistidine phosphatase